MANDSERVTEKTPEVYRGIGIYKETQTSLDSWLEIGREDPGTALYYLAYNSTDRKVIDLATRHLTSPTENSGLIEMFGIESLVTYPTGGELSLHNLRHRLTATTSLGDSFTDSVIFNLNNTPCIEDNEQYITDNLYLAQALMGGNALHDDKSRELFKLFLARGNCTDLAALIEDDEMNWGYRIKALDHLLDVSKEMIGNNEYSSEYALLCVNGLDSLVEKMVLTGEKTEAKKRIIEEVIAFLVTDVPVPHHFVPIRHIFKIADYLDNEGLKFVFLKRHLLNDPVWPRSDHADVKNDDDLRQVRLMCGQLDRQFENGMISEDEKKRLWSALLDLDVGYTDSKTKIETTLGKLGVKV